MLNRFTAEDKNGSRTAQLLYSSVLQTFANKATLEKMPQAEQCFRDRMDEANQIKTRIGDVQGIAMNRGITGNFYLFIKQDAATALDLYQEDLEVVKENNLISDFLAYGIELQLVTSIYIHKITISNIFKSPFTL